MTVRTAAQISSRPFGVLPSGETVELYTLRNVAGMQADIATYGGILTSLLVPDRAGHLADVVLGYDTLERYRKNRHYAGALIGRYANRISGGKFSLDGQTYHVSTNEGANSLHGGESGFDKALWTAGEAQLTIEGPQLRLLYESRGGDEGFPGALSVTATYTLLSDAVRVTFAATTTHTTIVSLSAHSYFNLAAQGDVLGHQIQINADRFTPVGEDLIPTGELRKVNCTPFDFREPTTIGARIDEPDEQLRRGHGYDHNWVLGGPAGALMVNAIASEPASGRVLEILSDQPGLQFYSGNFLDGSQIGKGGRRYERRHGFCFEPQQFPNAPNQPEFPSSVLTPDQEYRCTILYRFSTLPSTV